MEKEPRCELCRWTIVASVFIALQGCGVSIESKRIEAPAGGGILPFVIPGQGSSMALVRTRVEVVQPVSWTPASTTPVGDVFDKCLNACQDTGDSLQKTAAVCTVSKPQPQVSFLRPSVRTTTVPDPSRLYQTSVTPDLFQTAEVVTQAAPDGTLQDVSAKTSSVAFDALTAAIKAAAGMLSGNIYVPDKIITPAQTGSKPDDKAKRKAKCFDLADEMKGIASAAINSPRLSCGEVRAVQACIVADAGKSVEEEKQERDKLFDLAVEKKLDHQLLAAAVANRAERIASAQARYEAVRRYYSVGKKVVEPLSFSLVKKLKGPEEFRPYSASFDFENLLERGPEAWQIESQQDINALNILELTAQLKAERRSYKLYINLPNALPPVTLTEVEQGNCAKIKPNEPPVGPLGLGRRPNGDFFHSDDRVGTEACDKDRALYFSRTASIKLEESKIGSGFRYRIPIRSVATLDVFAPALPPNVDTLSSEIVIAQYGPIAAMPAHFKGKGGRIHLKLWPESGGLMTAEIGSTGVDASTINSVTEKLMTEYKERKAAAEAAAFKAGGADPTIEALRREKERKQLQKDIQKLDSGTD